MSRGGHWRQPAIGLCLWLVIGVVLSVVRPTRCATVVLATEHKQNSP
jgi:hypothetical protein